MKIQNTATLSFRRIEVREVNLTPNSAADGLPPIPVSYSGSSSYAFGVETRQLFSSVTGEYTDFPANGTALINTNVVRPPFPRPPPTPKTTKY